MNTEPPFDIPELAELYKHLRWNANRRPYRVEPRFGPEDNCWCGSRRRLRSCHKVSHNAVEFNQLIRTINSELITHHETNQATFSQAAQTDQ